VRSVPAEHVESLDNNPTINHQNIMPDTTTKSIAWSDGYFIAS
jgi:hypothetical protein